MWLICSVIIYFPSIKVIPYFKLIKLYYQFKFNYSKRKLLFLKLMYRTTIQNPSYANSFQSYQPRANSLSKTGTHFHQSRSPLYPIGPTLSQQQFNPIKRMPSPSPYLTSKQTIKPPSYEQRYLRTQMQQEKAGLSRTYNYEERQRKLIQGNQIQIKQEQKRRQALNQSYERQIENVTRILHKNLDRKQKLLLEIQVLEKNNQDFNQKLASANPPKKNTDLYEPLDRKQQEIIITKNKLLTDIREKEESYLKQQEQEEDYWETQIKEKEKILMRTQQNLKVKKMELLNTRMTVEKPDFIAIQDEVRQGKYQDFLYEAKVIEDKIQLLIRERQQQQREVDQSLKTKRQNIHCLIIKHEEKFRQNTTSKMRTEQLQRVCKEMESANDNLMRELERKEKMIEKYELDIFSLKERKDQQQASLNEMMKVAREDEMEQQLERDIESQISHTQQEIRVQSSANNKLKTQYQKLYEILCSTLSRNLNQTFNETLVA